MSESLAPTGTTGPAATSPAPTGATGSGFFSTIEKDAEADAGGFWAKVKAYFSGSVIATAIGAGAAGLLVGHFLIP